MARRTKLTPETKEAILRAVRAGLTYKAAAEVAGIGERTLYSWLQKGREQKSGIYVQFLHELKKAESEGELALVARIQKAAQEQWQAAAWLLERRYRERWGRNVDVTSGGRVIRFVWADDDEVEEEQV